ncbi:mannosyltransferase PMTI [Syncephalis plumigaleata]|nr:mannosyltransferase PMTI [Syncephalis plumigaleata]
MTSAQPDKAAPLPLEKKENKTTVVSTTVYTRNDYIALAIVTLLAFITRLYKLAIPAEVVFDEVHFGKFASYYLRGTYFFDVHPPLGKMLLAGVGWLAGYDGAFLFDTIGDNYITHKVPYMAYRSFTAICGALVIPIAYGIMRESGYSLLSTTMVAIMLAFDNALITQSRLILLDSMLMLFMIMAIYSYIRFYKLRYQPFTRVWWFWMVSTGISLGLTTSVKMVGLFVVALVGICVVWDLWNKLDYRQGLTMRQWTRHFFARVIGLIYVPLFVYLISFYIHFMVLNKSGPGDEFMSKGFQRTLIGSKILRHSYSIRDGDVIRLQNNENPGFLHSHFHNYPLRYDDGRISTQGQQVNTYQFPDSNNEWRVQLACHTPAEVDMLRAPSNKSLAPGRYLSRPIRHGDVIQLHHIATNKTMVTHDVASPLTTTNTEITAVDLDDPALSGRFIDSLFTLEIDDGEDATTSKTGYATIWKTQDQLVRIVQVRLGVTLHSGSAKLPDWGFQQYEVNGAKVKTGSGSAWTAKDIIGQIIIGQKKERQPVYRPFMSKFVELQSAMIIHNAGLTEKHPYQSAPYTWPLVLGGISFWTNNDTRQQIYLLANPFGWWLSDLALLVYPTLILADLLTRQRGFVAIDEPVRGRFYRSGGFLILGWALHYLPFFFMGRSLFLHHYLPACIIGYLAIGIIHQFACIPGIDQLSKRISTTTTTSTATDNKDVIKAPTFYRAIAPPLAWITAILIVTMQIGCFWYFKAPTYGHDSLTQEEWTARRWSPGWNFHFSS